MNDSNRKTHWLFVIVLVVLALVILYPPSEKLKGGIDLVGGTSLLYEIDTTGLEPSQRTGLAVKVMNILKDRVDPKGQRNLEWRPVGNTRLEVRMPRPPKRAFERRAAFNEARDRLIRPNLHRYDIESALNTAEADRAAAVDALAQGVQERKEPLAALVIAFDDYTTAQAGDDAAAQRAASDAYEKAVADVLVTSLPIDRLMDILALSAGKDRREKELQKLRDEFPSYDAGSETDEGGKLLTKSIAAYDAWAKHKADLEDPSDLKRLLRGAGVLEFRILADRDAGNPTLTTVPSNPQLAQPIKRYTDQLTRYGPRPKAGDRYAWFPIDNILSFLYIDNMDALEAARANPNLPIVEEYAGQYYVLAHNDPSYGLLKGTGRRSWSLREASPDRDPLSGRNAVAFRLDPRGGIMFGELTGNNIERQLCIMLDNVAMSHANIVSRINERGQISGDFTFEKVQALVRTLEAGSLPARLKEPPLMENTVGPSLGETNRTRGMNAAIMGTVAVVVFMIFYYGIAAGGMADLALMLNLLFVLAIMALLQATFTLPGIAGLILTIGMAIDANVLIFERIREERDRGVVFRRALNAGYDKAFSTILDANLTTLLICVILGSVGSEEVKGFAITLGIGISTSMFTALFVTRLIFNTLISAGWLKDLSMRRIIGQTSVDWLALRRIFWPVSIAMVGLGLSLFLFRASTHTEATFGIEFLGGTSLQLDLKPGVVMTDQDMEVEITGEGADDSAVHWLHAAAKHLASVEISGGDIPGDYTIHSNDLTGEEIMALISPTLNELIERNSKRIEGRTVLFTSKAGKLSGEDSVRAAVAGAAEYAEQAAQRLRSARVQRVGIAGDESALSFEVATIETNRELVQAAIMATLGQRLSVQRGLTFTTVRDTELTQEPFFVVEQDDHYLSDVIGGDSINDIRRFRGGVTVEVVLDQAEAPLTKEQFEKRMREVGLQPEFESIQTRESAIFPVGSTVNPNDEAKAYRHFAVVAVDDSLRYDDDPVQWSDQLAQSHLSLVSAALGREKSLSKVVQFAPQIAGQTKNRAIFAIILALGAIVAYLWLRFGTKEYGLAAIVALIHDVGITLGLVAASQLISDTVVGKALLIDGFRVDLPMVAAILTVIGYSLNDTIVVFDRIRENKGRIETINERIINTSINQTLSRTLLTSFTTFLVVAILYVAGGKGVHGFSFALLIGVVVGTYSSIGIATPLLYRPKLLHATVTLMAGAALMGVIYLAADNTTLRGVLLGLTALTCAFLLVRQRGAGGVSGRTASVSS